MKDFCFTMRKVYFIQMYNVILVYLLIDVVWLAIQMHTSQHYDTCPLCFSICLATMLHV